MAITSQLIECGLWAVLWHRLVQTLRTDALRVVEGLDNNAPSSMTSVQTPDWSLLSFKGLTTALGIATAIIIKVI